MGPLIGKTDEDRCLEAGKNIRQGKVRIELVDRKAGSVKSFLTVTE
jgi:hypothetical protein